MKLRAAHMLSEFLYRVTSPPVTLAEILGEYVNAKGDLTLRGALAKHRVGIEFGEIMGRNGWPVPGDL